MPDFAIKAEHLSKHYCVPAGNEPAPRHLREAIAASVTRVLCARPRSGTRELKALEDVSFCIQEGEKVGLIGLNGAGKSTLIRILAGITKPTSGRAEIAGRVSTVLEVGLGFHDELNGRENIYMMGALYGMDRKEIAAQFDSIVEFAGLADFLHAPVKHYSTGMRARLGFAVAAHLRSDIALLDEALAVGDLLFQEKCIRQMQEIAQKGKTVLLVSHSEYALQTFCTRVLVLDKGRLILDTQDIDQALDCYRGARNAPKAG